MQLNQKGHPLGLYVTAEEAALTRIFRISRSRLLHWSSPLVAYLYAVEEDDCERTFRVVCDS